jgi:GT2 family glycosyltransferase
VTTFAVVVIGRNEGERLVRCLESVRPHTRTLVYVDSGSTDDSVAQARARGAHVVELDASAPFTAARARNSGFERALAEDPSAEWVQFVDGDCEVVAEWWRSVDAWLPGDPRVAVICGRRRERHAEASIYNALCDVEWATPVGTAESCGGDALIRASAFREVGGFDLRLIAGEEPELCFRLRQRGHRIERIASEMTLHDASMSRFSQWWRRAVRAGHAYAENHALHGRSPERFKRKELLSILAWGGVLPAAALGLAPLTDGASLLALAIYSVLFLRVRRARLRVGTPSALASRYAAFVVIGKWAQLAGVAWFHWHRARGGRAGLIEYKRAA